MKRTEVRSHIAYFDFLRIFATLAVILVHVSAQNWEAVEVTSSTWKLFNIANSAGRWCVPMFCMISGALFLDNAKPLDTKRLLTHNLPRLVTAFLFWSGIYAAVMLLKGEALADVLPVFVKGHYHMWFLYMIAGLYLAAPVLRKVTESKTATEYFLVASFLFIIAIPRTLHFLGCLDLPYTLGALVDAAGEAYDYVNFLFLHTYGFYFVLGFYLYKYELGKTPRRWAYGLGIAGYFATVLLTNWYSVKTGGASVEFYADSSLNVFCMAVGLFLLGKYTLSRVELKETGRNRLQKVSQCTFGMYLGHALVMETFQERLGLNTLAFHPAISIVVITAAVAAVSYLLSALLNRIPVLGKYVV